MILDTYFVIRHRWGEVTYRPSSDECERDSWIFLDNFSTSFWWNSVIKIVRWFKLINSSNHLTIFLVEFRFNGSFAGASETHWECVSHCLKKRIPSNKIFYLYRDSNLCPYLSNYLQAMTLPTRSAITSYMNVSKCWLTIT